MSAGLFVKRSFSAAASALKMPYSVNTAGPFNWINNQKTGTTTGKTFDDIDPRTGQTLAKIPTSGHQEVEDAVAAARAAFPVWSQMSGADRGRILIKAANLIKDNLEDFAQAETLDNGKPIWESRMDMDTVTGAMEYYGGMAGTLTGQHVKLPGGSFAYVSKAKKLYFIA